VQAPYRAATSARYFIRGYRYGGHMPATGPASDGSNPESINPLTAYAETHPSGPGLFKWQHYFDIYDRHLRQFRGRDVTLVEIGVFGGGSLGMWRDYLGASAHICGIDIDPKCKRFETDDIEIVIGDQGDRGFWPSFLESHPQIDIVIDDGGHLPHQQAVTLEYLLPSVQPGGVYVCEDIHGPFQPFHAFVDGLTRQLNDIGGPGTETPVNSLQRHVAAIHRYPILVVIEMTATTPTKFEVRRYGSEWPEDWSSAPVPASKPAV
jgi:hypothetical protein